MSAIFPIGRWGPFADDIEPGERIARLRCLAAIVHIVCGPRGRGVFAILRNSEDNPAASADGLNAVLRLDPLDRRRVLTTYAAIHKPVDPRGWAARVGGDQ